MKRLKVFLPVFICLILEFGCTTTPRYNRTEYDRIIKMRVDAISLLNKATSTFSSYANEVEALKKEMQIAYEYAKNTQNNDQVTKQLSFMNDPNGLLLGKALKDWEEKGTLSEAYADGLIKNIEDGFDQISGLVSLLVRE